MIRHVNIDGVDRNACCGTQVPNLTHCGFVHVIPPSTPSTATKPSSNVPTKLYFTAGPRAIKYLQDASRSVSLAAQAIGVGRNDLVERAAKNEEQRRELISREKELRGEMAKMVAERAVAESDAQNGVVWIQRSDKATHDFEFLSAITTGFVLSSPPSEAGSSGAGVIVISSTLPGVSPSLFVIQSSEHELAKTVNDRIKSALEEGEKGRMKGGGAKGRYMSKVEGKWAKAENTKVEEVLKEVSGGGDGWLT